jgi:hypothetical protein
MEAPGHPNSFGGPDLCPALLQRRAGSSPAMDELAAVGLSDERHLCVVHEGCCGLLSRGVVRGEPPDLDEAQPEPVDPGDEPDHS